MKNTFKQIATLFTLLFSTFIFSQNDNSLLWKVTGNNLQKPSYIFGTIHMICENDYFLLPEVEEALNKSDALITEINFGNMEEMMIMQKSVQTDIPLKERTTPEQYEKLSLLLKQKLNMDIEGLDKVSEAGIASLITMKAFACESIKMYEIELLQKAMANKKTLAGL